MIRSTLLLITFVCLLVPCDTSAGNEDARIASSWSSVVLHAIQESEYHFSAAGARSWTAPNRSHNLRSTITSEGLHVVPRVRGEMAWEFDLQLVGIGRGGQMVRPGGHVRPGPEPTRSQSDAIP